MPIPTPFHPLTSKLCTSLRYKDWAGFHAVCAYDTYHDREYYALRNAAGLIDVTPLFKVDVRGPNAAAFLSYLTVRDIVTLQPEQVTYCCWCDEHGKVVDDGTVWRLADDHYRLTAAEPAWHWLSRHAAGFDVQVSDITERIGALSLQGPNARDVLGAVCDGGDIAGLQFFRLSRQRLGGDDVVVTRTGYTGDLGYEIWVPNEAAVRVYAALIEAGRPYGLLPAGLDAMDMTRIEAGFVLNGVDYFGALHCLIEARKSTPDEIGLGWTVRLNRETFLGQAAIQAERQRGKTWALVGLVLDWDEYEALFAEHDLPPQVPCGARAAVPVYDDRGRQIGQATCGTWSPLLKQNLALATVEARFGRPGTEVRIEVTAEFRRRTCRATVTRKPFFDPPRKKT